MTGPIGKTGGPGVSGPKMEMINGLLACKPRGMTPEQEQEWRSKMEAINGTVSSMRLLKT
ncbi:hypothetical protein M0R72_05800 [Candidatus Pacearchaeota archaeon]|jgi:hypothetical protein|nr:hypothetical protein [Candidatus Pacearchaeota archaeon]